MYSFCDGEIEKRLNNEYIKGGATYYNAGLSDYQCTGDKDVESACKTK